MNTFEIENISYQYNKVSPLTLANINAVIPEKKFTAIIGPNGSGKTTLFKCLCGELTPTTGIVRFQEKEIRTIPSRERAKKMAMVYQKHTNISDFTVREIIEMGRTPYQKMRHHLTVTDSAAITRAIKLVGLDSLESRTIDELSGGQQQRVWIALALAQEAKTLLLDEPTSFLDIKYQLEILHLLKRMVDLEEITVIAILHDINQILHFSDYILAIDRGTLAAEGITNEVLTIKLINKIFKVNATLVDNHRSTKLFDFFLEENSC